MLMLSHPVVSDSSTPWAVALQAPLSMGFPRQEYWSGLSFPLPGDLPDPGIEPVSPSSPALAGEFFTTETPEKPKTHCFVLYYIPQAASPHLYDPLRLSMVGAKFFGY